MLTRRRRTCGSTWPPLALLSRLGRRACSQFCAGAGSLVHGGEVRAVPIDRQLARCVGHLCRRSVGRRREHLHASRAVPISRELARRLSHLSIIVLLLSPGDHLLVQQSVLKLDEQRRVDRVHWRQLH